MLWIRLWWFQTHDLLLRKILRPGVLLTHDENNCKLSQCMTTVGCCLLYTTGQACLGVVDPQNNLFCTGLGGFPHRMMTAGKRSKDVFATLKGPCANDAVFPEPGHEIMALKQGLPSMVPDRLAKLILRNPLLPRPWA